MIFFWKPLMILTTDEAVDAAQIAINCLDVKHKEKRSV